jgi:hypothetical protein
LRFVRPWTQSGQAWPGTRSQDCRSKSWNSLSEALIGILSSRFNFAPLHCHYIAAQLAKKAEGIALKSSELCLRAPAPMESPMPLRA